MDEKKSNKPNFGKFTKGTKGGARGNLNPTAKLQKTSVAGWGSNPSVTSYSLSFNSAAQQKLFKSGDKYAEVGFNGKDSFFRVEKFPSGNFRENDARYSIQQSTGGYGNRSGVQICFPKSLVNAYPQISKMLGDLTIEWYDKDEIYLAPAER